MAADANRLAAALAYEDERRRRLAETIPTLTGPTTQPRRSVRTDLENLSAGLGRGITTQLQGIKGLVTDPVGTAKGAYEAARAVVRDPSVLAAALTQMGQKAASGPLGAGEVIGEMIGPRKTGPVMAELDVYHGTPHRFPATEANPLGEFDASKIGTGEGAQAYGHGVYFAESPGVAESYKKTLTRRKELDLWTDELRKQLPKALSKNEFDRFSVLNAKMRKDDSLSASELDEWRNLKTTQTNYDDAVARLQPKGALYKADLPDEMIDRMLDWDKPLSKDAPQAVKDAFNKLAQTYPDLKEKFFAFYREGRPGSWYYALLNDYAKTGNLVKNQSFASDAMRQAGIPGIKYLDAGSRGQGGSGTRNFVVFPGEEKKVRILERK